MRFLYPAFLVGAIAVAIPVVLHFLRRDIAPEIRFSAVRLLERSPVARSRRRRLRDLLLLAARAAALLLLAGAFARPYVAGASAAASIRIVALDRSFSMGAPGRFERGLELARQAIADAGSTERVALVAFDEAVVVVAEPGLPAEAETALKNVRPGFAATNYPAVFAKAAELAGDAAGRLIIVTDLQRSGWRGEQQGVLPAGLELEVRDAGALSGNVAVTAVRPTASAIIASIQNTGPNARRGEARVERDGRITASAPYSVAAAATIDVEIPYRVPATGSIAVSIADDGGIPADDRRFAILDPAPHPTVLLVTSGANESGFYVAHALAATSDEAAARLDARSVASASLSREMEARTVDLAGVSAVVLLSTRGLERRAWESLAAFVRTGGGLLIAGSPDVDPAVISSMFDWQPALDVAAAAVDGAALSPTDVRHPIFRPFGALTANLGQVRFERAWRIKGAGWNVVGRFTDGSPAMLERSEGSGRVLLFASDIDGRWNDFPRHPVFVPFALETLRYAAADRDRGREYVIGTEPTGTGPQPGIYRTADGRTVALNVDSRESATAALDAAAFQRMVERVKPAGGSVIDLRAQQVEGRQRYWQYGLLLMLAALVAESFVGRV